MAENAEVTEGQAVQQPAQQQPPQQGAFQQPAAQQQTAQMQGQPDPGKQTGDPGQPAQAPVQVNPFAADEAAIQQLNNRSVNLQQTVQGLQQQPQVKQDTGISKKLDQIMAELQSQRSLTKKIKDSYSQNMAKVKRGDMDDIDPDIPDPDPIPTPAQQGPQVDITQQIQQQVERVMAPARTFNEIRELQAQHPYYKTSIDIEALEKMPGHPEFRKVQEIVNLMNHRSIYYPGMRLSAVHSVLKAQIPAGGVHVPNMQQQVHNQQAVSQVANVLGGAQGSQVANQQTDRRDLTPSKVKQLTDQELNALVENNIEEERQSAKDQTW